MCWQRQNTKLVAYDPRTCYLLGGYSTEEKALEVLNMVQEAYAEYEMLFQAFMGIDSVYVTITEKEILDKKKGILRKKAIFQMPVDSEVEV